MTLNNRLRPAAGLLLITMLAACAVTGVDSTDPSQAPPATPEQAAPTLAPTADERPSQVNGAATQVFTPAVVKTQTLGQQNAVALPPQGSLQAVEVAVGLQAPVGFAAPRGIPGRIYILEQRGVIRVVQDGQLLADAFMDLTDRVGATANEQGLLGMDTEQDFAQNRLFYLNYTDTNGDTVIARYQANAGGLTGDPESEQVLIRVDQPYANHNGGGVVFGPDGYLYLSLGDGGSGGDPQGNAQNPNVLLGKILRIDVTGEHEYSIPDDNPFADGGGAPEVYAWGLRNPWRFSFDRQTGDLYIADVGQNAWEEIHFYPAGGPTGPNFGWDYYEASHSYEGSPPAGLALEMPVWEYDHGQGCSITGGYVYRGQNIPAHYGVYVYTDYCTGGVYGLLRVSGEWQSRRLLPLDGRFSAIGQDDQGEIYFLEHARGVLYRLEPAG